MLVKRILALFIGLTFIMAQGNKSLSLDDILSGKYQTARISTQWFPGEDAVLHFQYDSTINASHLQKVDIVTGDTLDWISAEHFKWEGIYLRISGITFDRNDKQLLIKTNEKAIWRHSRRATYFIYNIHNQTLSQIGDGQPISNVKFSPNGEMIAYVKSDNNLYNYWIKSNREKKLTRDGSDTILNGQLGWLYEEEFGLYDGFSWSPDSKRIAFYREDQSEVKKYTLFSDDSIYSSISEVYYPKAGDANPSLKIGIIRVNGGLIWSPIEANNDIYLPRMDWSPSGELFIQSLNRHQNELILYRYNPDNRKLHKVLLEKSKTWVTVYGSPEFLADGSFLWYSSRSGYKHIYRIINHKLIAITSGDWSVNRVLNVDEENGKIYFSGKMNSSLENHIYSVSVNGGSVSNLTSNSGWHTARLAPSNKYWIHSFSSLSDLPTHSLMDFEGNIKRHIKETNKTPFLEFPFTERKLIQFSTEDGTVLDASLSLPWNFDSSKKYPIIVYGYGLPNSQTVTNRWGGHRALLHQLFNQNGFIVASVNNRQVGGYGQKFMDNGYKDLGHYLILDHTNLIQHLGANSWADTSRVGIWGWSGGGYLTALALTKASKTFDVGVAVAPVTDWKYYDSAYTERFMGLPKENRQGYESASVMSYIDQFKGNLLVIHGTVDDNVHVQNTHQLINAFVKAGKPLDIFLYPGRNHGIYGGNTSKHLYEKMIQYFTDHL